jgi:O-antigen ligase
MPIRSGGPEVQVLAGTGQGKGHHLADADGIRRKEKPVREPLGGAYFWLTFFFLIYCARPEDWVPGLHVIPLAKITGICAVVGFVLSMGRARRSLQNLPRESLYLLAMIGLLCISAVLSPIWKGGAVSRTLDFSKVLVAWVLTYLVITNLERLRRIIFIETASVAVISIVSLLQSQSHPRLRGVLSGIYSNPNDLAFAIVLSLPFCLAFMLRTRSVPRKAAWAIAMAVMAAALFSTASRGGFVTLLVVGPVCLWHFAIKKRRPHLVVVALVLLIVTGVGGGERLKDRFFAISGEDLDTGLERSAHGSFEERRRLINLSLEGIAQYPLLGIGVGNFPTFSGSWREVHVAYLQIAVEGGIPVLILYLMFFWRGFANLRRLKRLPKSDPDIELFTGALHSSLVGFLVGALFAPEAYQYFPYFAVSYTAVLLAIVKEQQAARSEIRSQNAEVRQDGGIGAAISNRGLVPARHVDARR